MADNEGQPPVIDLSFLDTDWSPTGEDDGYKPLTPEQVAALLDEAARSAHDYIRTGRIHIRLTEAMQAADRVCPVDQRSAALSQLYVDHYREGASPALVTEMCRLMSSAADACSHYQPRDPAADDEIHARLKEHVRIGVIEAVRPASPSGWVVTAIGTEITLASQAQALAWLHAADAFINLLERQIGKDPSRLHSWAYWLIRSHHEEVGIGI
jgi:hypothetical protein